MENIWYNMISVENKVNMIKKERISTELDYYVITSYFNLDINTRRNVWAIVLNNIPKINYNK
jgi:hypothetical protein